MAKTVPNFSEQLQQLRKSTGLTQKELAEFLKLNIRQYQRYESSKVDPPLSKVITLADYFDVSLDYLVGRSDNPKRN